MMHSRWSQWFPSRDDSEQNHDDGDDKEGMNEGAYGGGSYQPQQLENDQHYRNCV